MKMVIEGKGINRKNSDHQNGGERPHKGKRAPSAGKMQILGRIF